METYPIEELDENYDDGTMPENVEELAKAVVGHGFGMIQDINAGAAAEFGAGYTMRGNRPYQEDAFAIGFDFAVLADGMGGQPDGDKASLRAVKRAVDSLEMGGTILAATEAADQALGDWIRTGDYGHNPGYWPATTLIVLAREENDFNVAHLGDSRVYLWNLDRGGLRQLTQDHESYFGSITRYVGGTGHEPDILNFSLVEGDRLITCSDGLFLHLSDVFLSRFIGENAAATDLDLAKLLCEEAVKAGGMDNVTVIVASFQEPT